MQTHHSSFDTRAVHGAREDLAGLGLHVPSIDLSSTNPVADVETGGAAYEHLATGGSLQPGQSAIYQRLWNPTVARFERALADLEGADQGVAFASGMAALSATLLACVAADTPHIVAVRPLYGGSDHILATGLLGTSVTYAAAHEVADVITEDTGLVIVETPANPSLDLVDISAVVAASGDVPVLVDNTFATPVLQQPIAHGARIVLHSATKFIGGHGDLLAGVIATDEEWAARIRSVRALTGGILYPMAAYQAHRGLQTLPVRVRAQQATAGVVATWLSSHAAVRAVHYPGGARVRSTRSRRHANVGPGSRVGLRGRVVRAGHRGGAVVRPHRPRCVSWRGRHLDPASVVVDAPPGGRTSAPRRVPAASSGRARRCPRPD